MSLDPGRQVIGIVAAEEGLDPGLARQRQAAGQQDLGALMVGDRHRIEQVEQSGQHRIEIGPLPFRADRLGRLVGQRQRVEGYIERGRSEGATVALGGGRPKDLRRGWYVEPTVFANVDNRMTIAREEIFGPVLAVIPYDDPDEVGTNVPRGIG